MAGPLIGEILAQGYQTGRAIGDDISGWRFRKGERQIEEKYRQRAEAEGKPIDAFRTEVQRELEDLYASSGARKRNLRGSDDSYLSDNSLSRFDSRAQEASAIRAGGLAREGKIADSRRALSDTYFNTGQYDSGISNRQAADTIDVTTGAIGKGMDGTYDSTGAAQGISTVHAKYGDAQGAVDANSKAAEFRLNMGGAYAGRLAMMMDNPKMYGDEIRGTLMAAKEYVPMLAAFDVVPDQNGVLTIFKGQQPVGSLDKKEEVEQLKMMLASMSKDPASILPEWEKGMVSAAEAAATKQNKREELGFTAVLEMVKEYAKKDPVGAELITKLGESAQKLSGSKWTLGAVLEDGSQTATLGNRVVHIIPPRPADGKNPATKGHMIDAATGDVVDPSELQDGKLLAEYASDFSELAAQKSDAIGRERLRFGLDLINRMVGGGGVGASVPSETGSANTPKFPLKETDDYVRNILSATGAVSGSNREKAQQLMGALVQQESGGDHSAVSPVGARGVTQVMPKTGKDPGFGVRPLQNDSREEYMRFGEDYLTAMLDRYDGDPALALAAYNAGPGRADEWQKQGLGMGAAMGAADTEGAAVAAAGKVAPTKTGALSAPPPSTEGRVSPDSLRERATSLTAAANEVRAWERELANFDSQNSTRAAPVFGRSDAIVGFNRSGDPQAVEMRQRIVAALADAKERADTLRAITRKEVGAFKAGQQMRAIDSDFEAIRQRVAQGGGAGDTVSQAWKDHVRRSITQQ